MGHKNINMYTHILNPVESNAYGAIIQHTGVCILFASVHVYIHVYMYSSHYSGQ